MVRYNTNFLCVSVMALGILFVVFDMYHKKVVEGNKSSRVYLVGDSTFDNTPYVAKGKDVFSYIQKKNSRAILNAIDDSKISDVYRQLDLVNATEHDTIFISVGGNDILAREMTLEQLMVKYRKMLSYVKKGKVVLCDLYYPPQMKHLHSIIRKWNTFIHLFNEDYEIKKISETMVLPEHFTNIIEPSELGSVVMAETICPGESCNPNANQG